MASQFRILAVAAACALLSACVATTPGWDVRFGDAVNMAKARQAADAQAPARNAGKDAAGVDGRTAKHSYDAYLKSYSQPESVGNVFAIGLTGGQSGAGK